MLRFQRPGRWRCRRVTTVRSDEFDETIIGKAASLEHQTAHSFSSFDADVTILDELGKIAFEHDGFENDACNEARMRAALWLHERFEVEIF